MRKATVEPLARYLYQLQLELTPLPYDEAEEILWLVESDLSDQIDALVELGTDPALAEQTVVAALMRPERLAKQYVHSFERKSAREFRTESVATNILAGTALFAGIYDHSTIAVILALFGLALVVFRICIHISPVGVASRAARWLPIWKLFSTLTGLAAAGFLAHDVWALDLTLHIAHDRASALLAVTNLPLHDLSHVLVILLSFLSQRSGMAAAKLSRSLSDSRKLRTRTATWRSRRMRNPMLPERDDIDGYWQLHNEVFQKIQEQRDRKAAE